VAATAAVAPANGSAVMFAGVTAETVFRAHGPHSQERTHDRVLHVIGDGQERAYPVTCVTGRDADREAEGTAEVSEHVPQVTIAVVHEGQASVDRNQFQTVPGRVCRGTHSVKAWLPKASTSTRAATIPVRTAVNTYIS